VPGDAGALETHRGLDRGVIRETPEKKNKKKTAISWKAKKKKVAQKGKPAVFQPTYLTRKNHKIQIAKTRTAHSQESKNETISIRDSFFFFFFFGYF
jgi:hypothetical protein